MNVLITGGAGFIGSHLAEHFLKQGDTVTILDNISAGSLDNLRHLQHHTTLHTIDADVLSTPDLAGIISTADRIYHLAAVVGVRATLQKSLTLLHTNIEGTARLLQEIAHTKPDVPTLLASSSEVYGLGEHVPSSENESLDLHMTINARNSYVVSKLANESYAESYTAHKGLNIVTVRFFNTVGLRQTSRYGMVVPNFVEHAINGSDIPVYGDGQQTRSFCDVRDTVVMLDALLSQEKSFGHTVNVGHDREISINALAELIRTRAGSHSNIIHIPYDKAYGCDYEDTLRRKPDLTLLNSLIHYKHRWTLEQTIDDLIRYTKQKAGT